MWYTQYSWWEAKKRSTIIINKIINRSLLFSKIVSIWPFTGPTFPVILWGEVEHHYFPWTMPIGITLRNGRELICLSMAINWKKVVNLCREMTQNSFHVKIHSKIKRKAERLNFFPLQNLVDKRNIQGQRRNYYCQPPLQWSGFIWVFRL